MQKTLSRVREDVDRLLPNLDIRRMFDVGGNVGQTVSAMRRYFPEAEVWTFEPVLSSYRVLESLAAEHDGVRPFNLALGSVDGSALVTARPTWVKNHVVADGNLARADEPTQEVTIATGDAFCAEHGLDQIDYLKIDTEGHELEVLRGFSGMLADFGVDLLEVEVGMNWENSRQVPLEHVKGYLEPMGYFVFRLYEQVPERSGRPHLRRVTAVFVSRPVIDANVRPHTATATT